MILGSVAAGVLGLLLYPPLIIGSGLGLVGGFALGAYSGAPLGALRRRMALSGVLIAALYLLALGLSDAVELFSQFNRRWQSGVALSVDPGAMLARPWAWLPPAIAIALLVGAGATYLGRRSR